MPATFQLSKNPAVNFVVSHRADGDFNRDVVLPDLLTPRRRKLVDLPWTQLSEVHGLSSLWVNSPGEFDGETGDVLGDDLPLGDHERHHPPEDKNEPGPFDQHHQMVAIKLHSPIRALTPSNWTRDSSRTAGSAAMMRAWRSCRSAIKRSIWARVRGRSRSLPSKTISD